MSKQEILRRRSKDRQSKIAELFVRQSISTLNKARNNILLITFSLVAYLGATQKEFSPTGIFFFAISFTLGILSFVFSYIYMIKLAAYHAQKEKNFSHAFPTLPEFNEMVQEDSKLSLTYNTLHKQNTYAIICLVLQLIMLVIGTFTTIDNDTDTTTRFDKKILKHDIPISSPHQRNSPAYR